MSPRARTTSGSSDSASCAVASIWHSYGVTGLPGRHTRSPAATTVATGGGSVVVVAVVVVVVVVGGSLDAPSPEHAASTRAARTVLRNRFEARTRRRATIRAPKRRGRGSVGGVGERFGKSRMHQQRLG